MSTQPVNAPQSNNNKPGNPGIAPNSSIWDQPKQDYNKTPQYNPGTNSAGTPPPLHSGGFTQGANTGSYSNSGVPNNAGGYSNPGMGANSGVPNNTGGYSNPGVPNNPGGYSNPGMGANSGGFPNSNQTVWECSVQDIWKAYDKNINNIIETHYNQGLPTVEFQMHGNRYIIFFRDMKQKLSSDHTKTRQVRRRQI